LNDLVARRRQLVEMIVMEGNRLEKLPADSVRQSIAQIMTLLQQQRQEIDNKIAEHLRSDDQWNGKVQLLKAFPASDRSPPPRWWRNCRNWAN
jgi:transposase